MASAMAESPGRARLSLPDRRYPDRARHVHSSQVGHTNAVVRRNLLVKDII